MSAAIRFRVCSVTACSPEKKIPDHQDEDHEWNQQQNDIPTCP
jgi:hypothetical protein